MKKYFYIIVLIAITSGFSMSQPRISFTFDDGDTSAIAGYSNEQWNEMLLGHLKDDGITAALFVKGKNLDNEKGKLIIKSWNDAGHMICNHSYSHRNYNSSVFEDYKADFLKDDSLISGYSNYTKLFRFPYLKEGESAEKINLFRDLLKDNSYRNGSVTIDASDWYVNGRLIKKLDLDPLASIEGYRDFYLKHLLARAEYYESLAFDLTGRNINHVILLHHNLTSALFLGDLIAMFKEKGWEIMSAKDAYNDSIFESNPTNVPAGESLIWALAKQSGMYDSLLRYPAEDGEYEKDEMDRLGL
ncbi:MAG: polysaccharide deacetylase family protein [bacterium]